MTKKIVLWIGLIGVGLFFIAMYPVNMSVCDKSSYDCRKTSDLVQMILGIFSFVLLFSLITYKLREEVFRAWWNFARWFVPIIMLATFLLNSAHRGGGIAGAAAGGFNMFVLGVLYVIFVITSLVKIVAAYRESR